jgi:lipoprotein-anchoring transpeptidase ErfK/SrfK
LTDYYSILRRAVVSLNPDTAQARSELYERARSMLIERLRADQATTPVARLNAERAAFEDAVKRLEAEMGQSVLTPRTRPARHASPPAATPASSEQAMRLPPVRLARPVLFGILGIAAALVVTVGLYAVLKKPPAPAPQTAAAPAPPAIEKAASAPVPAPTPALASSAPGEELEPGVDGGSSEAGLPYYYRRQPVYYRTIHPVGTVVVDPSQRFLYLVQPKVMALRYGIGIGSECTGTAALRRITGKIEWPEWVPSADLPKRRSYPPRLAGGPGNPLGARALVLDDARAGIHGTNAPKSIGHTLVFGCYRMVNDDVIDLYQRVSTGTAVVVVN